MLVADAGQPVGRRTLGDADLDGHAVGIDPVAGIRSGREHLDGGDLELAGRRRSVGVGPAAPAATRRGGRRAICRQLRGAGDDRRLILVQHPQADLLDLVAEGGRPFELELLGGRPHLGLHPGHELLDLALVELDEPGVALFALRGVDRCRLGDRPELVVQVADALDDRRRLDPVLRVVGHLDRAPAVRLADRRLHRVGHRVGVHDDLAADVPSGPPDHLDQ